MTEHDKNRDPKCSLDRRELCKTIPCAAVGVYASAGFFGDCTSRKLVPVEFYSGQEETMANIITAEVISQKGTCAQGHEVGDTITITENGVEGKICIHALYAVLPKIFAMMFDAQFPWLEDPDVSTGACPDAYNPVVFQISRKKA